MNYMVLKHLKCEIIEYFGHGKKFVKMVNTSIIAFSVIRSITSKRITLSGGEGNLLLFSVALTLTVEERRRILHLEVCQRFVYKAYMLGINQLWVKICLVWNKGMNICVSFLSWSFFSFFFKNFGLRSLWIFVGSC